MKINDFMHFKFLKIFLKKVLTKQNVCDKIYKSLARETSSKMTLGL